MQHYFQAHGVPDATRSYHQGEVVLGKLVAQQSLILAFSDAFYVMGVVLVSAAVAIVLTRSAPRGVIAAHE